MLRSSAPMTSTGVAAQRHGPLLPTRRPASLHPITQRLRMLAPSCPGRRHVAAAAGPPVDMGQLAEGLSASLADAVGAVTSAAPEAMRPAVALLGEDVMSVVALHPTAEAIARLGALWYLLFAQPSPLVTIIDFYITGPLVLAFSGNFKGQVFTLRDRLGGGNFGVTFEGVKDTERVTSAVLSPEQKRKRVVMKKVNIDANTASGIRKNFLRGGTMAQGAGETGKVESYICRKMSRYPLIRPVVAKYLGEYVADETGGGFVKGGEWLVWDFQSDSTLYDALEGALGKFPEDVADIFLGASADSYDEEKRNALIVRNIMKQTLQGLAKLHRVGIVHRDVKPENILITVDGKVLLIDFGAAVDFSTGVNFNPLNGMLDPRYSPPEQLITPDNFPKAPVAGLAALGGPLAYASVRPDLFDTFSCGMLLLQMGVPQLRTAVQQRALQAEFEKYDYDLFVWREEYPKARNMDFSILDRNNGAGFDLAAKLLCKRNKLYRGRLSASEALRHPYFLLPA